MMEQFDIKQGVCIRIEKHIPVAAGMAGGSTDCAAVLYGMNKLFDLQLSQKKLREIGVKLGADVPYCLMRRTALSEGIGEILTPVAPLPDCPILIAKPSISVSTRYVYEHLKLNEETLHPDVDGIVSALKAKDLYGVTDRLGNVLETVTIPEHPVIADIKQQMMQSGAVNALMSGSGPTVFGIFDDEDKLAGTITLSKCLDLTAKARFYYSLENLVIDENYRHQGYGQALMQYVEDYVRRHNGRYVNLTSAVHRTDAHEFYYRIGFPRNYTIGFKKNVVDD